MSSIYNSKVDLLKSWAKSYYNTGIILASDEEYDKLYKEVIAMEIDMPVKDRRVDSPTTNIGAILEKQSKFKKDRHIEKMYSLDNVYSIEEFRTWYDKVDLTNHHNDMILMHKYDGLSLNLYYEYGLLVKATTRGDGLTGELVTINARQIKSIPTKIDYLKPLEVRGEVMMSFDTFNGLNKLKVESNEDIFASPRNAAVGSLRNLNPMVTRERSLIFKAWGVGYSELDSQSLSDVYDFLKDKGFIVDYTRVSTVAELDDYYNDVITKRDNLDYPIDGIVVKFNSLSLCSDLGFTNKYPKWAIAFKLPPLERVSKLISIDNQVGKTGVVTPVANITPIDIDGVLVSKVTLHNYNEIKLKDLRINDSIVVIRSGDVIPKITTVLKDRRDGTQLEIHNPTECPVCNSTLIAKGPNLYCSNDSCRAKVLGKLIHFVSRDGLNIDGMSEATIEAIMNREECNGVKNGSFEFYINTIINLDMNTLLSLDGFSTKKADNILKAIANAKTIELYKLIDALSIPNIGTTASKAIVSKYKTLDTLVEATYDGLISIDGIGKVQAESFISFIKENESILWSLMMFGFTVINSMAITGNDTVLVSATGKFPISRKNVIGMAANYLQLLDVEYTDKITKDVRLLVVGDGPSSKLDKAKKLNIEIKYFDDIVNGR